MTTSSQTPNLKIALLITGRVKNSWKYSLDQTLKNVINELNPTIFVSTYSQNYDYADLRDFANAYDIPFEPERFNIQTFKIKNKDHKAWSDSPSPDDSSISDPAAIYRFGSMFFHNKRAFEMMTNYSTENGIAFDRVIKWRCDILPFTKLPSDFLRPLSDNEILIPRDENQYNFKSGPAKDNWSKIYPKNRISAREQRSLLQITPDQMAIGTVKSMSIYCNISNNLEKYYDQYSIKIGPGHCPEKTINDHLEIEDVKWSFTENTWLYMMKQVYDSTRPDYKEFSLKANYDRDLEEKFYRKQLIYEKDSANNVESGPGPEKPGSEPGLEPLSKLAVSFKDPVSEVLNGSQYQYQHQSQSNFKKITEILPKENKESIQKQISNPISRDLSSNKNQNRPLLQFVMIVKDAAISIRECLESYKPYISYWFVLDTGSTDGTQDIIKDVFKGIPGSLEQGPFINFDVTRNEAIKRMKRPCTFYIMPDDSYIAYGFDKIHNILQKAVNIPENVISIKVKGIDCDYNRNLIAKTDANLIYGGGIHADILDGKTAFITDDDVFIEDRYYKQQHARSKDRWRDKDIPSIMSLHLQEPEASRHPFYLAMTYYAIDEIEEAIKWFQKRISYKDEYHEERFVAMVNLGMLISYPATNPDQIDSKNIHSKVPVKLLKDDPSANCMTRRFGTERAMYYLASALSEYPSRAAEVYYQIALCYKRDLDDFQAGKNVNLTKSLEDTENRDAYIRALERLVYINIKEASTYDIPKNTVLFLDTKIYTKQVPMLCTLYSIRNNDNMYAYQQIQKLKKFHPNDRDVQSFIEEINIDSLIILSQPSTATNIIKHSKKVIVFVTGGYYENWLPHPDKLSLSGTNLKSGSLGGSEYMLSSFAEYFSTKGYEVYAFIQNETNTNVTIRGVTYRSNETFKQFVDENHVDFCIISRHADYLRAIKDKAHVKHAFVWCHDVSFVGVPICSKHNFRKFIALCPWQKDLVSKEFSIPQDLMAIQTNCINIEMFKDVNDVDKVLARKKPMTFIYSSSNERGLVHVLNIFPFIRKEFPDATLIVCADMVNTSGPADIKILKNMQKYKEFVILKGRLGREELYAEMEKSEYFLYASIYPETFCISSLEAAAGGAINICSDLAALKTTVGDRGFLFPHELLTNEVKGPQIEVVAKLIIDFLKSLTYEKKRDLVQRGLDFAKSMSRENAGLRFEKLLLDCEK
jgi:glycosyltransferase involved in cell wall biosynthesis/tetratricopeptide (TPR) repeat protein